MKLNNKGFSLIEGLLIVIAVTLIAGVGYYVYDANKTESSETVSQEQETVNSTQLEEQQEENTNEKEYIEFQKLGIKIEKTSETDEFTYEDYIGDDSTLVLTIKSLNFKTLEEKTCSSPSGLNGRVATITKESGKFPDGQIYQKLVKQFDDFALVSNFPGNGLVCVSGSDSGGEKFFNSLDEYRKKAEATLRSAEEL